MTTFNTAGDPVERVAVEDMRPGDRVARARTHTFREIDWLDPGPTACYLHYRNWGGRDRPRLTAQWWRVCEPPAAPSGEAKG